MEPKVNHKGTKGGTSMEPKVSDRHTKVGNSKAPMAHTPKATYRHKMLKLRATNRMSFSYHERYENKNPTIS